MVKVDWMATWQGGNISKDGIFNDLSDSNLVFLPYCSGDAWMGNGTAWGIPFRGRHIVQTLISELDVQPGDDFLLSGCSAGGRGAMVQLDTVRELLPSGCHVRGVLDSPAWQDMDLFYPEPTAHTFGSQCELAYIHFAPPISPACASAYPQEDHWRCICGEYTLPHLREDYFLIAYLYDSFQLTALEVWMHPPYEGARLEYAESFAQHMNNTVREVHRAGKAVSAPACYLHCATEDSRFHAVAADGVIVSALFLEWYNNTRANTSLSSQEPRDALIAVDHCEGFDCGAGCSHSWVKAPPPPEPLSPPPSLWLSNAFGDHMVLQRDGPYSIFGWSSNLVNAAVAVEVSDQHGRVSFGSGTVQASGRWQVSPSPAVGAGGPFSVSVSAEGVTFAHLSDVHFGDVFLCAGQSNMQFPATGDLTYNCSEATQLPLVRLFQVQRTSERRVPQDVEPGVAQYGGAWAVSSEEAVCGEMETHTWHYFSAVCFFFGAEVQRALGDVPVGLVEADWGGTAVQVWQSPAAVAACNTPPVHPSPWAPTDYSALWHTMVAPLAELALSGIVWYQGESNARQAQAYRCMFPALVRDWQGRFPHAASQTPLPFIYVELAGTTHMGEGFADLRLAQLAALALPGVARATAVDLADPASPYSAIHPRWKLDIGRRAALQYLHLTRQLPSGTVFEGPSLHTVTSISGDLPPLPSDGQVVLRLSGEGSGELSLRGTRGCTSCCAGGKSSDQGTAGLFVVRLADGEHTAYLESISGWSVVVSFSIGITVYDVEELLYAHTNQPECLLYNAEGFPMSPFAVAMPQLASAPSSLKQGYTHFKFYPYAIRSESDPYCGNIVQLEEIMLYDVFGQLMSNVAASNPYGDNPAGQGPDQAVDGSGETKWVDRNHGPLVLQPAEATLLSAYSWVTADDCPSRDPVSWYLEASRDGGATFWQLDHRRDVPVTETRKWTAGVYFIESLPSNLSSGSGLPSPSPPTSPPPSPPPPKAVTEEGTAGVLLPIYVFLPLLFAGLVSLIQALQAGTAYLKRFQENTQYNPLSISDSISSQNPDL
ncbi:hypothetical protein CYMTET_4755 [Cymbomonas tetramitiformis]|uniref:Sialate O-acetylesterase domain-containing protein n=1 Tax=Cymbomonas tetramitiformis TaxID=36881 RepID=A0AAE0LJK7_9CHLO|nr:hypothetical protein CYMTET_4755 [Cymbomonas tetramitiformis]